MSPYDTPLENITSECQIPLHEYFIIIINQILRLFIFKISPDSTNYFSETPPLPLVNKGLYTHLDGDAIRGTLYGVYLQLIRFAMVCSIVKDCRFHNRTTMGKKAS